MFTPGVSFQPGSPDAQQQQQTRPQGSQQGVQEAIKVLSLRLPKVVGSQAAAPQALLSSQGSGGRPHVDSIVQQVLQKYFPTQGGGGAQAPMLGGAPETARPESGPQVSGAPSGTPRITQSEPTPNFWTQFPRVVVTPSVPAGDFTVDETGRPTNPGGPGPGGVFEDAPDLRKQLDWMRQPTWGGSDRDEGPPQI